MKGLETSSSLNFTLKSLFFEKLFPNVWHNLLLLSRQTVTRLKFMVLLVDFKVYCSFSEMSEFINLNIYSDSSLDLDE